MSLDLIRVFPGVKEFVYTRPTIIRLVGIAFQVSEDRWLSLAEYHSLLAAFADQVAAE
jgi:hypothetical protein